LCRLTESARSAARGLCFVAPLANADGADGKRCGRGTVLDSELGVNLFEISYGSNGVNGNRAKARVHRDGRLVQ
jgi:hypothetical protein